MNLALVRELIQIVSAVDDDDQIGAVVLTGEGRGFCAGSDLADLAVMTSPERKQFEAESGLLARMIGQSDTPFVAAVHGFAIGGGLTLAAACDIVVTDPVAKWSMPEVPIGLFPAWGIGAIADRVGVPDARRLCWGIDTLSGKEAKCWGLADAIAEQPLAEAEAIATQLCALSRAQVRAVKRFFGAVWAHEQCDLAANRLFLVAAESPEAKATFARFTLRKKSGD